MNDHSRKSAFQGASVCALPFPVLAGTGLSDIRDIVESPAHWPWYVAAGLLLLAAALFLWHRRTKHGPELAAARIEPPDAKALRLLNELRQQAESMEAEAFTVEVSSILRHYLEEALRIPAPEQTSDEFLHELRSQSWLTPELQQNLEEFMPLADLVKFAQQALTVSQRTRLLDSARQVIEATRPKPTPESVLS